MKPSHHLAGLGILVVLVCMGVSFITNGYADFDSRIEDGTAATVILPKKHVFPFSHRVIIGFGDSITLGYPYVTGSGDGRRVGGYEPKLEALLRTTGGRWKVLNYGLEGETTYGGVDRIYSVVAGHNRAYVLLLEGTNDFGWGISYDTTVYNLGVMIDISKNAGLTPVISTLTPDSQPNIGNQKNIPNTYNPAIAALAQEKNVVLCDQFAALIGNWDSWTDDQLHPNDAGYQIMADTWYLALVVRP